MAQTIIITGATGNLGTAVTKKMIAEGFTVVATVAPGERKEEHQDTASLQYWEVDLADEEVVAVFIKEIQAEYGEIHGAIMLAGGFGMNGILDTASSDIDDMVTLNFKTAYHIARPFLQLSQSQQQMGRLVFVGAKPATMLAEAEGVTAYALSKSMVMNLAEMINGASNQYNASAAVVVPSIIDTPPNRSAMPDADFSTWVTPEEIAHTIAFIFAEKSSPLRSGVFKLYGDV